SSLFIASRPSSKRASAVDVSAAKATGVTASVRAKAAAAAARRYGVGRIDRCIHQLSGESRASFAQRECWTVVCVPAGLGSAGFVVVVGLVSGGVVPLGFVAGLVDVPLAGFAVGATFAGEPVGSGGGVGAAGTTDAVGVGSAFAVSTGCARLATGGTTGSSGGGSTLEVVAALLLRSWVAPTT